MFHREFPRFSNFKRIAAVMAAVTVAASGLFAVNAVAANAAARTCEEGTGSVRIKFSDGKTYTLPAYNCDVQQSHTVFGGDPREADFFDTEIGVQHKNNNSDNSRFFYCQVEGDEENAVNGNNWYVLSMTSDGNKKIGFSSVEYTTKGREMSGNKRLPVIPNCVEGGSGRTSDNFVVPASAEGRQASLNRDDDEDDDRSADVESSDDDSETKSFRVARMYDENHNFAPTAPVYAKAERTKANWNPKTRLESGQHEFECQKKGGENPPTYVVSKGGTKNTNTYWARLAGSEDVSGWVPLTYIKQGSSGERLLGLKTC